MPRSILACGIAVAASLTSLSAGSMVFAQDIRPSFDCHRATFPDERTICADGKLAQMDQAAALALGMIKKDMIKAARENAFDSLKDRHACGTNKLCILDNQALVIEMLDDYGAKVPVPPWVGEYRLALVDAGAPMEKGLPKRIGACTRTKIVQIGTRFSETLKPPKGDGVDEGTSVGYANEGFQISYSYNPALAASAIGDEIVLCLVSLPKDCPPGDERGKVYSATNLRTKGSWIMPDSQHMCGGA